MTTTRELPGPPGHLLIGNLPEYKEDFLAASIAWQAQYGDLLRFKLGPREAYLISHPELFDEALVRQPDVFAKMSYAEKPNGLALVLGQGLVTSTGALWRQQRRLMQPVFNRSSIITMLPAMCAACEQLFLRWEALSDDSVVDLAEEMMRLTVEVITQTMFGTSILGQVEQISHAQTRAMRFAAKGLMNPFQPPLWFPTPANRQFKRDCRFLDDMIYSIIAQRRRNAGDALDLLHMLLAAEDPETGEKMDDRQIRDEVLTIFSAGHATTANALSWAFALLGTHPDVMQALKQELATVLQGKTPDLHSLNKLVYTKAVLDETLRIRPSIGIMARQLTEKVDFHGYALNHGSMAIFSIYNMHHHRDFWDAPEHFKPERFLGVEKRNKAYLPFGIGHRVCIGNHFALLEGQLFLAMLLQRYDIQLVNPTLPAMDMAISIKPKGGLPVRIRRIV